MLGPAPLMACSLVMAFWRAPVHHPKVAPPCLVLLKSLLKDPSSSTPVASPSAIPAGDITTFAEAPCMTKLASPSTIVLSSCQRAGLVLGFVSVTVVAIDRLFWIVFMLLCFQFCLRLASSGRPNNQQLGSYYNRRSYNGSVRGIFGSSKVTQLLTPDGCGLSNTLSQYDYWNTPVCSWQKMLLLCEINLLQPPTGNKTWHI